MRLEIDRDRRCALNIIEFIQVEVIVAGRNVVESLHVVVPQERRVAGEENVGDHPDCPHISRTRT